MANFWATFEKNWLLYIPTSGHTSHHQQHRHDLVSDHDFGYMGQRKLKVFFPLSHTLSIFLSLSLSLESKLLPQLLLCQILFVRSETTSFQFRMICWKSPFKRLKTTLIIIIIHDCFIEMTDEEQRYLLTFWAQGWSKKILFKKIKLWPNSKMTFSDKVNQFGR